MLQKFDEPLGTNYTTKLQGKSQMKGCSPKSSEDCNDIGLLPHERRWEEVRLQVRRQRKSNNFSRRRCHGSTKEPKSQLWNGVDCSEGTNEVEILSTPRSLSSFSSNLQSSHDRVLSRNMDFIVTLGLFILEPNHSLCGEASAPYHRKSEEDGWRIAAGV